MPFHLKYRPKTFDEFIGNRSTIISLQSVLNSDSPPHTFLFTGESGCGKTTLAKIVANELGCRELDFKEINTADYRGIDSARDIIEKCQYTSLFGGDVKCYLMDECHQLTRIAQEALLKVLEDTPSHVYFLLCTTEPEKLIKTIRSRCSTFHVNKLSSCQIIPLLADVIKKEGKEVSPEHIEQVAEAANGSPRQALIMLEQVIDLPTREIGRTIRRIKDREKEAIDLCKAMLDGKNWKIVASILKNLKNEEDIETARRIIAGYISAVLLSNDDSFTAYYLSKFKDPFYYSGKPGFIFACWEVSHHK
jgi:DNA polymerase-3 subunit gamma/tau